MSASSKSCSVVKCLGDIFFRKGTAVIMNVPGIQLRLRPVPVDHIIVWNSSSWFQFANHFATTGFMLIACKLCRFHEMLANELYNARNLWFHLCKCAIRTFKNILNLLFTRSRLLACENVRRIVLCGGLSWNLSVLLAHIVKFSMFSLTLWPLKLFCAYHSSIC